MNPYESPKIAQPVTATSILDVAEPVVAEFDFTPDFVIGILQRHRSLHRLSKLFDVLKYLVALGLVIMGTFAIFGGSVSGIVLCGVGAFLLFSSPINKWQIRQNLRTSPYTNETVRLEFSDAGMHALSQSQDSKLKWNVFTRMVQFDEGVLLMQGPNQCNWIPNESILGEHGRERLDNLLSVKIANCEDRRTRRSS